VFAANKSCKARPDLFKSELKCTCGKNLSGLFRFDRSDDSRIFSSKKLPLVAFCPYQQPSDENYFEGEGTYLFEGAAIVNGIIERSESDSLGDTAEFSVDTNDSKDLIRPRYLLTSLRLNDQAFRKFQIPKLTPKHPCWIANAKIEIKSIETNHDAGTDNGGNFLLDYRVLDVGKYRDCKR
jgi:hypothetical protein